MKTLHNYISKLYTKNKNIQKKTEYSLTKLKNNSFYSRSTLITLDFIDLKLKVYTGKDFISILVTPEMVGFRLGEFVNTRVKFEFKKKRKKKKS